MQSPPESPPSTSQASEELFGLLADRTRLRLLGLLRAEGTAGRELCVGDLVEILDLPQPTVSRHLGRLRRAGWVVVRRRDPWAFYSLAPAAGGGRLAELLSFCDAAESAHDLARLAARRSQGGCCPP